jgi:hypothetical protein
VNTLLLPAVPLLLLLLLGQLSQASSAMCGTRGAMADSRPCMQDRKQTKHAHQQVLLEFLCIPQEVECDICTHMSAFKHYTCLYMTTV